MVKKTISIILLFSFPVWLFGGVEFDRVDEFVESASAFDISGFTGITAGAWVFYNGGGTDEHNVFSNWDGAENAGIMVRIEPATGVVEVFLITVNNNFVAFDTATTISTGVWTHIAVRYDKVEYTCWINGIEDSNNDTDTNNLDATSSTNNFQIGNSPHNTATVDCFDGIITSVFLDDKAWTDSQMLINGTAKIKRMPLQFDVLHYWPLDEEEDGSSADGDSFFDMGRGNIDLVGDDGANNTGLTAKAEEILSYP